jgi:trans-aconitate 2-methyltransferase
MTEWDAAGYAKRSALQESMAAEVLALLDLKGSGRILDVGCGDGRISVEIASRVPRGSVIGIDASREMIAFANQHGAPGRANLRFEVCDARQIPFRGDFDLVVSFNALHWIPEQAEALRAIHAALKSDGRAQLRLVPMGPRKSIETVLEETRQSPRWSQYFSGFRDPYLRLTQEQYAQLAEDNGFRVLRFSTAAKSWDFKTREAFFNFGAVTFVEWIRRLPEHEKSAFITDVLDRYQSVAAHQPPAAAPQVPRHSDAGSSAEESLLPSAPPNAEPPSANVFRFYQMDISLERS